MKPRSPQVWAYVAAPILIGVAVLIRNALLGDTGEPEPDLLLLAVAIAGALGGMGPAVVATAVGLLEEIYFQTEPVRTFLVPRHRDQVELLVFLVSGIAIAVTFEIVRRVRQRERAVRRTLLMVTRCNEAILRATTEEELYAYICKVIVDDGGYRMCWVGLAEHDEPSALARSDPGSLARKNPGARGVTGASARAEEGGEEVEAAPAGDDGRHGDQEASLSRVRSVVRAGHASGEPAADVLAGRVPGGAPSEDAGGVAWEEPGLRVGAADPGAERGGAGRRGRAVAGATATRPTPLGSGPRPVQGSRYGIP